MMNQCRPARRSVFAACAAAATAAFSLRGLATVLMVPVMMTLASCGDSFDRSTPEGTIAAAKQVVADGRADRLGRFIYAENEDMRRLMNRLGVFLGNVQKLGATVQEKFPEEIEAMRRAAEEAAARGETTNFFSQLAGQMNRGSQNAARGGRGNRRGGPPGGQDSARMRNAFDALMKQVLADPYAWAREVEGAADRFSTVTITDTTVALQFDGEPVLAPIGMTMRQAEDGKWYFVLPTNLPGVSNFMPKTKEQYQIFGGLIKVFDQVVIDLRNDVENGRIQNLDGLASAAGEKAFIPIAMTFFAYTRLTEAQRKERQAAPKVVAPPG
jgi:hypothetical protein